MTKSAVSHEPPLVIARSQRRSGKLMHKLYAIAVGGRPRPPSSLRGTDGSVAISFGGRDYHRLRPHNDTCRLCAQIACRGVRPRPPAEVCTKLNGRARTSDGAVPLCLLRRHFPHLMGESSSPTMSLRGIADAVAISTAAEIITGFALIMTPAAITRKPDIRVIARALALW